MLSASRSEARDFEQVHQKVQRTPRNCFPSMEAFVPGKNQTYSQGYRRDHPRANRELLGTKYGLLLHHREDQIRLSHRSKFPKSV